MSGTVSSTIIDDGDPNVTYVPAGQWTVHTNVNLSFQLFNNTDTFSSVQGATATVIFYGDAIEYWGNQGPFHGPCTISLDGQAMTTVNSNAATDDVPILLYSNNNLTLGDHSLELRVVDSSFPNVCEVDRFVTNVTSSTRTNPPGNQNATSSQSTSTLASTIGFVAQSTSFGRDISSSSNANASPTADAGSTRNNRQRSTSVPLAAIVGAAIGVAIVCLILLIFYLFRRARKRKKSRRDAIISKPFVIHDEPSSPVPQTPSFYQTSEENRTSYRASPVDQPSYTYQGDSRLPAKLVTRPRPRPVAFHPSLPYPQSPSDFASCSSPTSDGLPSDIATISPTSMSKLEESQRNPPGPKPASASQRVYVVNNRGESSIGSGRFSDTLVPVRNDVPPPAYDA